MNIKKGLRKTLGGLFAGGATISMGFLSFAGMFLISPGLGLCLSALVLAIAYEGQVYNEGISIALRRIFDANYLKKAIARRYINDEFKKIREQLVGLKDDEKIPLDKIPNAFLKAYYEQKVYLAKLEEDHKLSHKLKDNVRAAKRNMAQLELLFIQYLNEKLPEKNELTDALPQVIGANADVIIKELNRKKWLVRLSWIFALGGGISSGFAALSAIEAGVATLATTFTFLSVIPGGVLVALAAFAAAGYTFMLYQTMTDMVQSYSGNWKDYLAARPKESSLQHGLRIVGIVFVVAIGIFATIATAGTWWYATQKGAMVVKMGEFAADMVRNISVPLMIVATLFYNVTNSISSVDKISRSSFGILLEKKRDAVWYAWKNENIVQFINPFRIIEKFISYTAQGLFFIGHIISMGLTTDRLDPIPPLVNAIGSAANEATVDLNYLPHDEDEHHHSHSSALLNVIFAPITVLVFGFKVLGAFWDMPFSSYQEAKEKFFECHKVPKIPELPVLLNNWNQGHSFIQFRLEKNADGKSSVVEIPSASGMNGQTRSKKGYGHRQDHELQPLLFTNVNGHPKKDDNSASDDMEINNGFSPG